MVLVFALMAHQPNAHVKQSTLSAVMQSPPVAIDGLLSEHQVDLIYNACFVAKRISRVSISRPRGTKYWTDLAVLTQVQADLAVYINERFSLSLRPLSNTYYEVEPGGVFPSRTLRLGYGVSLIVFLKAEDIMSDWSFATSDVIDNDERLSPSFIGGILSQEVPKASSSFPRDEHFFPFEPGDAVLFSGSHSFHSFVGPAPDERHFVMFHFSD